ncbi:2-dehydro-3-deoxyphosphogluconate aldolase/(4S)-4-hydroxy-2-oxoglutarate aldolase [Melghirimyces profundicolus]|uniref:2-dehydro-3-deoxyphosphogluconate aldolase/(4S)-4-hydroxy-2-oxoglutarate aldolase n=1 Tax=Melghirimyces profundicolus TaxID=1242148 RepID=A0A2T6BQY1_9BACL|nr:bifunctional 2-keto-4-hydroxyglutarate aldolase/2-keto-3-deoxy-6-phosphogluconate aldolase [Melghirimyces profundicolus]PTX58501.1 2-dehydro-3-deoxyphosphogluconate aldolase/(4S)-4-hydroxy-2-oxoglutarate aldolase [Melghirimyces profundicolus]
MKQWRVLSQLVKERVVAVIRGETPEQAEAAAAACYRGGIRTLEVTFTVPEAERVIGNLRRRFPEALIGAGTVLDAETARMAISAGASFVVSPHPEETLARMCHRYQVPYLPGCMTVKEMVGALEWGCSILKLFPGNAFGPAFLRSLKGPLPQAEFMPTGGVNVENVTDWLQSGAVAVGIGGELIRPAENGDFEEVERRARELMARVKTDREEVGDV